MSNTIKSATGNLPQIIHPNTGAVALLVEGTFIALSKAIDTAITQETRWIMTRIEAPYTTFGLNQSHAWIQSRLRQNRPT